jgi:hypothetical protein
VVSWSTSGVRRWASRYGADTLHEIAPWGLVAATDGTVYACGYSATGPDLASMTVKYSPSGKTLWKKVYRGPAGLGALTYMAVARPGGGVYVCGSANSGATGYDGLVMSYTAGGARDVFALDTGPGGASIETFVDLVVTATGQVVAVGSVTAGGNSDCRAVSYTLDGTIAGGVTLPGACSRLRRVLRDRHLPHRGRQDRHPDDARLGAPRRRRLPQPLGAGVRVGRQRAQRHRRPGHHRMRGRTLRRRHGAGHRPSRPGVRVLT